MLWNFDNRTGSAARERRGLDPVVLRHRGSQGGSHTGSLCLATRVRERDR